MRDKGFVVSSFAYPYGIRNRKIDRALLNHFKILRGATYGKKDPSRHKNFANGSRIVFGLGIDKHYGNNIAYILKMLEYAKKNSKIVIFFGHHASNKSNSYKYTTTYSTLETICKYVVTNNMRFMTMKDLIIDHPY